ncbi:hypothetical protein METBIDRAFT_10993 [Metschnikowia bicuspidata var. bicuspidata NRRL YB-4993]|uniref:Uncharacterized protein n=1 Tax=Metschnikowia bicuspidata var. bicuspidata NRRL YB-4993 TaxID=869754 RepID=A0A1A0HDE6_9ASCO|nr:hypothetical protein METBIDRAFT_10993 [Metschnikowia bicuspidata var. bicuspidata NRRL YB-4993]OBA22104.1 hypothetical protein METBIDRAFT_10993 [Metschnikowia bicuspidata var. bicuspidata NRRL YB-4993]
MPVSSTPSKRVALAPINVNVASPLHTLKTRHPTTAPGLPLTPGLTPKLGLVKSMTSLAPAGPRASALSGAARARKMDSFSEYKITNSKNVKADLAATKLKLRLQLAVYKLRLGRDAAMAPAPTFRVSKPLRLLTLLRLLPVFSESANVNLQRPQPAPRAAPAEPAAAASMKLYHIKPLSAFYNAYSHQLPLTSTHLQRLPPVNKILRTPIKAASRALLQMGAAHAASNSDETIDETVHESGGGLLKRKADILGSSPLRHNSFGNGIGTPNSFSVAKSLLQLGLGLY